MNTAGTHNTPALKSVLPTLCFSILIGIMLGTEQLFASSTEYGACGDGTHNSLYEACDDGNRKKGDGCSPICNIETGFVCLPSPADESTVCEFACGNGKGNNGEWCDDGNLRNGDGCNSKCKIEKGYHCIFEFWDMDLPSQCFMYCGNGELDDFFHRLAPEQCDDGNTKSGDGCSKKCNVERGFVCIQDNPEEPSFCERPCGNGEFNAGERCDDGNRTGGDGCSAKCKVERRFVCTWEDRSGPSDCNPK